MTQSQKETIANLNKIGIQFESRSAKSPDFEQHKKNTYKTSKYQY